MRRREFLENASLALGATALAAQAQATEPAAAAAPVAAADWRGLRAQFSLTPDYVHLATFLLASHPAPVARAIETHRRALDANPADYYHSHGIAMEGDCARAAADYMGGRWQQVALTDSTTMGLAMVYSGLRVQAGDELLQTVHDHYSTDMSLQHKAARSGATVRRVALYDEPATVSVEQCQARLKSAITARTRVVAVTWVHSSTGVKLPVQALAQVVEEANRDRDESARILFCVDGVHGFGIEDQDVTQLGCDFFIAGTHKWIFGPRGTGMIWGSDAGWARCEPVIPAFGAAYGPWLGLLKPEHVPRGMYFTPGGFHSFEHRWALPEAFRLHLQLGKANVQARIHALNTQTKEGLAAMPHVTLHTPADSALSSGLVCFDVAGMKPQQVVERLHAKGIIMSATPYRQSHARFAPSLLNDEAEIDRALAQIRALA
ncbi:MAG: aminotransferase [Halioglobus sp.]|nr:aminotransferase [Halioglobus sp.]|tara:strand:- start:2982 stop:4283 length:1302 start_codon:yes stop_codon:yes gene_type:complete